MNETSFCMIEHWKEAKQSINRQSSVGNRIWLRDSSFVDYVNTIFRIRFQRTGKETLNNAGQKRRLFCGLRLFTPSIVFDILSKKSNRTIHHLFSLIKINSFVMIPLKSKQQRTVYWCFIFYRKNTSASKENTAIKAGIDQFRLWIDVCVMCW